MERKIYGIFVAGGNGSRMGSDIPKQFLPLEGVPVLQRTLERFLEAIPDLSVITVLPSAHIDDWREMCLAGSLNCRQILVPGGITRFHSVQNALKYVPDGVTVMIHDGVRPLLSVGMIRRMAGLMKEHKALVPVVPLVDTLRYRDGSLPSPDRNRIVAVQTPQVFHSEDIKAAYSRAFSENFTDDASVAASAGIPVTQTDGERFNIKITTKEDLVLARAIICSSSGIF